MEALWIKVRIIKRGEMVEEMKEVNRIGGVVLMGELVS